MASTPKSHALVFAAAAVIAAPLARKLTDVVWTATTGKPSPESIDDPDEQLREVVAFAILSGAAAGLIRMLINRNARKVLQA